MGTFQRSFSLAKASWGVLRQDKELALLPLFSFLAWIVVAATFVLAMVVVVGDGTGGDSWTQNSVSWVLAFVGYFALAYVMVFFNAAVICAADERLRGGDPTIGSALRGAADRAGVILPWAVLSATVSLVLRAIEGRSGVVGRVVAGLVGLAWSLVTFLVLPILVVERVGVRDAVRRSMELFKRTWGENVVTNGGIGLIAIVAILAGALVSVPFSVVGLPVLGLALGVAWFAVVCCVTVALSGILQLALYRYAVDGTVPGFGDDTLRDAFRPRRARRFFN